MKSNQELAPHKPYYTTFENYLKREIAIAETRLSWLKSQWQWEPLTGLTRGQQLIAIANRPTQAQIDDYQTEAIAAASILAFLKDQLWRFKQ